MNQFLVLAEAAPTGGVAGGLITTILYFVVLVGIMYFLIIRPQRKRERSIQEMQNSIKIGDSIMTTGGIFGKVVDVVNDVCVVELGLNKGVRVPLQKSYIAAIKEPNMTVKKEEVEDKKVDKKEEKPSKK